MALTDVLARRGAEWITFDTNVLFAAPPTSDAEREGWAQVARGERADYTLPELAISASYVPDAARTAAYGEKYAWFRAAYPALKELYARMG